jgi:hypothetical protein
MSCNVEHPDPANGNSPDTTSERRDELASGHTCAEQVRAGIHLVRRNEVRAGLEKLAKHASEMTVGKLTEYIRAIDGEPPGSDWREGCRSKNQLSDKPPEYLLGLLIPRRALTFVSAPAFNGKSWMTIEIANAISKGEGLWGFAGPAQPVPVIYHVPEMNESWVRYYMDKVGVEDTENFLVRPMELGVWPLDDPRFLKSAEGRVVVIDTTGYFNPAEDTSDYKQSIKFAQLVFNVIQAGAEAVVGLCHPPKYASQPSAKGGQVPPWTLENSVIGSAGYGGILRSCLRIKNLNPDQNDSHTWLYAQGMKNPGLKPFQLEGPAPLRLKSKSGDSPYLSEILREMAGQDPQEQMLRACVREGLRVNQAERKLKEAFKEKVWSHGKVSNRYRKIEAEIKAADQMEIGEP